VGENPPAPNLPNFRQRLFPFVLSLSKQERTLKVVNELFNPCLSATSISVRAELVEVGTDAQCRKWAFQSLPFDRLRANGLKNMSSTRFLRQAQDRQGKRIEKWASETQGD
jgi:hypothetical protein